MYIRSFLLSIFLVCSACKEVSKHIQREESIPQRETFKVIGISDGDTVKLLINGVEQKVRLAHIDCPERRQAFGNVAKQEVSHLIFGKNVKLNHQEERDKYGRLIAEIIMEDGTNLNKLLVKKGLAWHFKKYSNNQEYAQLEIEARQNKVGLWSDEHAMSPSDFRKLSRRKN
ncbi:nuclease [Ornithobacterium rhinotracheale]|uniref:Nuclease n=1 Tax=Ornithobacterium rhinotracheale TaxID=28251 RepID=A0A410JPN6_ORNRH|nr:thermonuclease family protein [Ornithobacterium rhinotracheale]QAR30110.1 nuclease [Ornithobacterium rhinotracheale]